MMEQATQIAHVALPGLVARFPPMATYGAEQLTRTREDLAFNVQFLAAAMVVADDTIFIEFLNWLQSLLVNRGVPGTALPAGLEALRPGVHDVYPEGVRLLDIGHRMLAEASTATDLHAE